VTAGRWCKRSSNTAPRSGATPRLIIHEEYRLTLGELTKQNIKDIHSGENWQNSLENVYAHAMSLPRTNISPASIDQVSFDEPDRCLPLIHLTGTTQIFQ